MQQAIVKDPFFLQQKSVPATKADLFLAQDLQDTLLAHRESCVGLAANMIGFQKRVIIFMYGMLPMVMFNPVFIQKSGPYETEEGCLSLTGSRLTIRYQKITVEYLDQNWLKKTIKEGKADNYTEYDLGEKLNSFRAADPKYVTLSFSTIPAYQANAAMAHYMPSKEQSDVVKPEGLFLVDSGAHYLDGTTDVTRTIALGDITPEQSRDYTLAVIGMLNLMFAVFPYYATAPNLDTYARQTMWRYGRDFGHGTGHGVGYFLNVHEGPQVLSYYAPIHSASGMKAGMITSNEPGLYRPGQWGIRIENLAVNRRVKNPAETAFGDYLYFETLTLCPIDTRLIDKTLLNETETRWLNAYHALVREKLAPHTTGAAHDWLIKNTEAI